MTTKVISKEELEEKKAAAAEASELKEGVRIKMRKVVLGKIGAKLEFEKISTRYFENKDGVLELREFFTDGKETIPFALHPDFVLAIDLFRSHLMLACQQREGYDKYGNLIDPQTFESFDGPENENPLSRYKIASFELHGGEMGVTITGTRRLRGKITMPLVAEVKFFGDEATYEFIDELQHVTKNAMQRAVAYYNGEIAPDYQTSLDFDGNASDLDDDTDSPI